jgi:hypothetical protein
MARAVCTVRDYSAAGDDVQFQFHVLFFGSDVPGGQDSTLVAATFPPGTTTDAMRDRTLAAVAAEAANLGYDIAVGDIILPGLTT